MPTDEDQLERALGLAYDYLNRRERTVSGMRAHLARHDLGDAAIQQALEILGDQGYLDDARYARLFAQDKRELEGWGNERIRRTLLACGVERELVDEVLQGEDERGRALALLRRRFPSLPADRRERERALGMLLRKGYDSEVALDALSLHASETGEVGLR